MNCLVMRLHVSMAAIDPPKFDVLYSQAARESRAPGLGFSVLER